MMTSGIWFAPPRALTCLHTRPPTPTSSHVHEVLRHPSALLRRDDPRENDIRILFRVLFRARLSVPASPDCSLARLSAKYRTFADGPSVCFQNSGARADPDEESGAIQHTAVSYVHPGTGRTLLSRNSPCASRPPWSIVVPQASLVAVTDGAPTGANRAQGSGVWPSLSGRTGLGAALAMADLELRLRAPCKLESISQLELDRVLEPCAHYTEYSPSIAQAA